jgi:hypothetical protein
VRGPRDFGLSCGSDSRVSGGNGAFGAQWAAEREHPLPERQRARELRLRVDVPVVDERPAPTPGVRRHSWSSTDSSSVVRRLWAPSRGIALPLHAESAAHEHCATTHNELAIWRVLMPSPFRDAWCITPLRGAGEGARIYPGGALGPWPVASRARGTRIGVRVARNECSNSPRNLLEWLPESATLAARSCEAASCAIVSYAAMPSADACSLGVMSRAGALPVSPTWARSLAPTRAAHLPRGAIRRWHDVRRLALSFDQGCAHVGRVEHRFAPYVFAPYVFASPHQTAARSGRPRAQRSPTPPGLPQRPRSRLAQRPRGARWRSPRRTRATDNEAPRSRRAPRGSGP